MKITQASYDALKNEIYTTLMNVQTTNPETGEKWEPGMGEMGECSDEAARIVDEWMESQKIELIDENLTQFEIFVNKLEDELSKRVAATGQSSMSTMDSWAYGWNADTHKAMHFLMSKNSSGLHIQYRISYEVTDWTITKS